MTIKLILVARVGLTVALACWDECSYYTLHHYRWILSWVIECVRSLSLLKLNIVRVFGGFRGLRFEICNSKSSIKSCYKFLVKFDYSMLFEIHI